MKQYPKVNADVYKFNPKDKRPGRIGSTLGSAEELAVRFKQFYKELDSYTFDSIVKRLWLEQHFTYNGNPRRVRFGNGFASDWSWGFFMRFLVGSHNRANDSLLSVAVSTYLKEFFPDFMLHDPFKEPEYYKFPYQNVSLAHMAFVHMMHNRIEILDYAEKEGLGFVDFVNWVYNWAQCYNDEIGENKYQLSRSWSRWSHIKNKDLGRGWTVDKFKFDIKK